MASKPVMTAVETRLAANWTHTPIRTQNAADGSVPSDGNAFLFVDYPVAVEDQASIGSPGANLWRETGGFRIAIAIPIGAGIDPWAARIDTLRGVFRGKVFDGVRTYQASPPIEDGETDDGAFYVLSFAVAYDYDLIG